MLYTVTYIYGTNFKFFEYICNWYEFFSFKRNSKSFKNFPKKFENFMNCIRHMILSLKNTSKNFIHIQLQNGSKLSDGQWGLKLVVMGLSFQG